MSMKQANVGRPLLFLLRIIEQRVNKWSAHDLSLRKPFCSSTTIAFTSKKEVSLLFSTVDELRRLIPL